MTPNQERLLRFAQGLTPGTWTHLGEDALPDTRVLADMDLVEITLAEDQYRAKFEEGFPPSFNDLSEEDREALSTHEITKFEQLGSGWRDDHIECAAVRVHTCDNAGNSRRIDVSLWHCGPEIIGAIRYADESPRAFADIVKEIRQTEEKPLKFINGESSMEIDEALSTRSGSTSSQHTSSHQHQFGGATLEN